MGGTDFEEGDSIRLDRFDIAVDNFGDVYVVGQTSSFDFPLTTGADQTNSEAANDVFVAKINPAVPGPAGLIYSTLLSGSIGTVAGGALNEAEGIAVDANGNFYVVGLTTATNFPVTGGAYATMNRGGYDVFVAKFGSPRDLSVTMMASSEPVIAGSNVTYTIQINNNGRSPFTGVTNIVRLLNNPPIISASSTGGNISTNTPGQVILNIGNMPNNASITETIVVGTSSPGALTNIATVSSIETPTLEPNTDNNVSTVVSTIRGIADVRVSTASGAPNPVIAGSNLTYTITVANKGPWPATSVVLTDTLRASLMFVSAVTNGLSSASYDTNSGIVTFNFVTLTNGASATVMINAIATTPGAVTSVATVSAYELDLNPNNNSATVMTTVNGLTDLSIAFQNPPRTGFAGNNVTYTLRVTNHGPYAASSPVVSDAVPSGASFVFATTSQGTFSQSNGVVTWTLGNMASNGTANLTLTVKPAAQSVLTNIATISNSASTDLTLANNSASVVTTISPAADLGVSQAVSPSSLQVTSNCTCTVTVTNRGPSTAVNIILTDILPPGLSMQSVQPPPGSSYTQTNGVITCKIPSLASAASADLVLGFYAGLDGTFTNTASVSSATADLNPNNTSSLLVTVAPNPKAALLKIARSGSNVVLYWATNAAGYTLQSRTTFSNASLWGAVTNVPRRVGAQYFVTNGTFAGTSFYRLIQSNALFLNVMLAGSNIILSWSTNAVGYTLQSTTNFSDASSWRAVTNMPNPVAGQFYVTNDTAAGRSFYRLIK